MRASSVLLFPPLRRTKVKYSKNLFFHRCTFSEEVDQTGHLTDGNTFEEIHLDELPHQSQHQPLLALAGVEGVAVDPDDDTADGLGGVDGQGQVLVLLGVKKWSIRC